MFAHALSSRFLVICWGKITERHKKDDLPMHFGDIEGSYGPSAGCCASHSRQSADGLGFDQHFAQTGRMYVSDGALGSHPATHYRRRSSQSSDEVSLHTHPSVTTAVMLSQTAYSHGGGRPTPEFQMRVSRGVLSLSER
eukprot:scaffold334_cov241-Pinguiococcus_pyrenoidosus.AAC.27